MFSPQITVLMPVYNGAKFLRAAIESILWQTFQDFEFLIINDCSTDESREIVNFYKDGRIKLIGNEKNIGMVGSLNRGLRRARGRYIARMDADDISMPNRFERQYEYLERNPEVVALGSNALVIDPDDMPIYVIEQELEHDKIDRRHMLAKGGSIVHPSAMIKTSTLIDLGGYCADIDPAGDIDLFLRLAEVGKLANLPEVLLHYRHHFGRTTDLRRKDQMENTRSAVKRAYVRRGIDFPSDLKLPAIKNIQPIDRMRQWVNLSLRAGYYATSRKYAFRIFRQNWFSPAAWRLCSRALVASMCSTSLR